MDYLSLFYIIMLLNLTISLARTIFSKKHKQARNVFGGGGGGGGKGGGKDAPAQAMPAPAPTPAAPTADSQVTADAVTSSQRQRAAAAGLSSTDNTGGTLSGNPNQLNTQQPTLLG